MFAANTYALIERTQMVEGQTEQHRLAATV